MSIDDWLKRMGATQQEAKELRWYLAYLRWRKSVEHLIGLDASNALEPRASCRAHQASSKLVGERHV